MTTYLLNTLLCSAFLLVFYRLHYATAVMHRFKRWYLLLALPFSLLIPLLSFPKEGLPPMVPQPCIGLLLDTEADPIVRTASGADWEAIGWTVWLVGAALLFIRFAFNLLTVIRRKRSGEVHLIHGLQVVLTDAAIAPHSFGRWMFLNRKDCEHLRVPSDIFIHERQHIRARHTIDIIGIELLQILWWFNPLLPLYKREVLLNHEFEADAAVLKEREKTGYQELLLRWSCRALPLTSAIHYSPLKRRFHMMHQQTPIAIRRLKMLGLLPTLFFFVFLFSNRADAQELPPPVTVQGKASQAPTVITVTGKPLPKESPSQAELTQWLDAKMYGVWIDEKRVDNAVLKNYKPEDFSRVFVSRLRPNAVNYGKHYYQVDLSTNAFYEAYRKRMESNQ